MTTQQTIRVDNRQTVRLADVVAVAQGAGVAIDPAVNDLLAERRRQVVEKIESTREPAYGFNRGFGHNVDRPVPPERLGQLQENLIRSHACGTGAPAPVEVVRAAMFLRLVSLARGHSGVRPEVLQMLAGLLNQHLTPEVPLYGSVSASGDLAPLSHIALVLIGEGYVVEGGTRRPAAKALKAAGIRPLKLEMKEGLALNNGVQYATAFGILSCFRLMQLLKTAAIATAISTQVMLGSDTPFRADLHRLRPHRGGVQVAQWIRRLCAGSPLRQAHAPYTIDGEIQDPYNLRCAAQILGTCYDLIREAEDTFAVEAASVTDNPLILADETDNGQFTRIVSGGHFHGMPVAVKLYNLVQAMGSMSRLSNMRAARYIDESRNKGLGPDLKWPDLERDTYATCSGLMLLEYASAALTNTIWGAAMPSHLFSLATDAGQEDHVSMAAGLAVRIWENLPRLAEVLAVELAMGAQAAAIRRCRNHLRSKIPISRALSEKTRKARDIYQNILKLSLPDQNFRVQLDVRLEYPIGEDQRLLSPACEVAVDEIRRRFPTVLEDRCMADDLQGLAAYLLSGDLLERVEALTPLAHGN